MFFYDGVIKSFSEENNVPRTLFKARKVAGSTYKHINKVEQYEILMSFFYSVYSVRVTLFSLLRNKCIS